MAMSESTLQMQLARDPVFLNRLNYLMLTQAREVKAEAKETPYHYKRTTYASQVLSNSAMMVQQASFVIVGGVNLIGTVSMTDNGVVTTVTDQELFSQVATFWNMLAGIDSADDPNATAPVVFTPPPPAGLTFPAPAPAPLPNTRSK